MSDNSFSKRHVHFHTQLDAALAELLGIGRPVNPLNAIVQLSKVLHHWCAHVCTLLLTPDSLGTCGALDQAAQAFFWLGFALKSHYIPLDIDVDSETDDPMTSGTQAEPSDASMCLSDWVAQGDAFEDIWCKPCNNVRASVQDMFAETTVIESAADASVIRSSTTSAISGLNTQQNRILTSLRTILTQGADLTFAGKIQDKEIFQQLHELRCESSVVVKDLLVLLKTCLQPLSEANSQLKPILQQQERLCDEFLHWYSRTSFSMLTDKSAELSKVVSQKPWYPLVVQTHAARYACKTADLLLDGFLQLRKPGGVSDVYASYLWFLTRTRGYTPTLPTDHVFLELDSTRAATHILRAAIEGLNDDKYTASAPIFCLWIDLWLRKLPALRRFLMTDRKLRDALQSIITPMVANSTDVASSSPTYQDKPGHYVALCTTRALLDQLDQPDQLFDREDVFQTTRSDLGNELPAKQLNLIQCLESSSAHPFTKVAYAFLLAAMDHNETEPIRWATCVAADRRLAHRDELFTKLLAIIYNMEDSLDHDFQLVELSGSATIALHLVNGVQAEIAKGSLDADISKIAYTLLQEISGYSTLCKMGEPQGEVKTSESCSICYDPDGLYRVALQNWTLASSANRQGTLPNISTIRVMQWAAFLGQPYAQMEMGNVWHNIWRTPSQCQDLLVHRPSEHAWKQAVYWYICGATSPNEVSDHSLAHLEILLKAAPIDGL